MSKSHMVDEDNQDIQKKLLPQEPQPIEEKVQPEQILDPVEETQIYYHTRIKAYIAAEKREKTIIHEQSGILRPKRLTALMGPSGSGKTTLLNFLGGRLEATNMKVEGEIQFNGEKIPSLEPYSTIIGYVMQKDYLIPVLTVWQTFQFACKIRLGLSQQKTNLVVASLIKSLGLEQCKYVPIGLGNAAFQGVSGGQMRRVSIGVQIITNPRIIFLDEPTTGLDSASALIVIDLLKKLSNQGRTIVTVIHQPSYQVFNLFDDLILLANGRCVYIGPTNQSRNYFKRQNYIIQKGINESQFYLDLLSLTEGNINAILQPLKEARNIKPGEIVPPELQNQAYMQATQKHANKIYAMAQFLKKSQYYNFKKNNELQPTKIPKEPSRSDWTQLKLMADRGVKIQLRNPFDMYLKLLNSLFTAIFMYLVIIRIDNNNSQNVRGFVFFMGSFSIFTAIQGTLTCFLPEINVFKRERYTKSYKTYTYFLGRTGITIPFQIVYATLPIFLLYWATGLGKSTFHEFAMFFLTLNSAYFSASGFGYAFSVLFSSIQSAMAVVPVILIPLMVLGGYFANLNNIQDARYFLWSIMYISPFRYTYQALMGSLEYQNTYDQSRNPEPIWANIVGLLGLGLITRILAVVILTFVSNPKRPKMVDIVDQSHFDPKEQAKNIVVDKE